MKNLDMILLLAMVCGAGSAIAGGGASSDTPAGQGKHVFDKWCAPCHAPAPSRTSGTASLAVKYGGSLPAALEEREDMTPEFVRHFVRTGVLIMPPFRKTEISDAELDALGAYLTRNVNKSKRKE